jgi:hypothetical protein
MLEVIAAVSIATNAVLFLRVMRQRKAIIEMSAAVSRVMAKMIQMLALTEEQSAKSNPQEQGEVQQTSNIYGSEKGS